MEKYEKGPTLGEGTFGSVFKAIHKETKDVVAIKKIHVTNTKEGVNVTALREIKLLKELNSPHIIRLIDVFPHKKNISLVFEYMESDLEAVIKDRTIVLGAADIKSYLQMTLQAINFCHKHWVVHRDIKPNNLLIAPTGELKLADFGLARLIGSPDRRYTNQVFARWYRAPELFFGASLYGFNVDIWAVGCVFAELLLRQPWFPGGSDIDQLGRIFAALGTPTESNWPGVSNLPQYLEFTPSEGQGIRAIFPKASEDALDLLGQMMRLNPSDRITAEDALHHRYFTTSPLPTPAAMLPRPKSRASAPLQQRPLPVIEITHVENKDVKQARDQSQSEALEADAPSAKKMRAAATASPATSKDAAGRQAFGRLTPPVRS